MCFRTLVTGIFLTLLLKQLGHSGNYEKLLFRIWILCWKIMFFDFMLNSSTCFYWIPYVVIKSNHIVASFLFLPSEFVQLQLWIIPRMICRWFCFSHMNFSVGFILVAIATCHCCLLVLQECVEYERPKQFGFECCATFIRVPWYNCCKINCQRFMLDIIMCFLLILYDNNI